MPPRARSPRWRASPASPATRGDGGPATSAKLNLPEGIALDSSGNIFIADAGNSAIREVSAATGMITTVAGNGTTGNSGNGGPATAAELNAPASVAVDSAGNLFIADTNNNEIREVSAATGNISVVAGNGVAGYSGDGGSPTSAELNQPVGVAVDRSGNLYIADRLNSVIREVPTTLVGQDVTVTPAPLSITAVSQTMVGRPGRARAHGVIQRVRQRRFRGKSHDTAGALHLSDVGKPARRLFHHGQRRQLRRITRSRLSPALSLSHPRHHRRATDDRRRIRGDQPEVQQEAQADRQADPLRLYDHVQHRDGPDGTRQPRQLSGRPESIKKVQGRQEEDQQRYRAASRSDSRVSGHKQLCHADARRQAKFPKGGQITVIAGSVDDTSHVFLAQNACCRSLPKARGSL